MENRTPVGSTKRPDSRSPMKLLLASTSNTSRTTQESASWNRSLQADPRGIPRKSFMKSNSRETKSPLKYRRRWLKTLRGNMETRLRYMKLMIHRNTKYFSRKELELWYQKLSAQRTL